jgi:hypothetical protein
MRADEISSKSTVATGRAIVALSSSILLVKLFGLEQESVDFLQNVKLTGSKMDLVGAALLVHLDYAHLTNWSVDRAVAPDLEREICYFGDHPSSWDCENPPIRGRISNVWIALRSGFGYSVWTPRVSLVYGLHLLLPATLWISAAMALALA